MITFHQWSLFPPTFYKFSKKCKNGHLENFPFWPKNTSIFFTFLHFFEHFTLLTTVSFVILTYTFLKLRNKYFSWFFPLIWSYYISIIFLIHIHEWKHENENKRLSWQKQVKPKTTANMKQIEKWATTPVAMT